MGGLELNKIFAAVLLAGVIAMVAGFLADLLVEPEDLQQNAYVIEVSDDGAAAPAVPEEPAGPPEIAPLLASADPSAGESAVRACAACHSFDQGGRNGVGPNLWDVVMGPMAHMDAFNYSSALSDRAADGGEWTYESLNQFLYAPRDYISGTSMSYAGVKNDQDRANIIAYLRSLSDAPAPLPEAAQ